MSADPKYKISKTINDIPIVDSKAGAGLVQYSPQVVMIDENTDRRTGFLLNRQPSVDVKIGVSSSFEGLKVSPATVTFTSTNWHQIQVQLKSDMN